MVFSQSDIKNINDIYELNKDNTDDDFINSIKIFLETTYKNDRTRSNKLSLYKKYIKENNLLKDESNLWKIGDEELRQKLKQEFINRPLEKKILIQTETIDKILNYKNSNFPEELLIFNLFNTGRRISEFLKGNWFIENGKLYIDTLSKKRKNEDDKYEIFTAIQNPEESLKLINKVNEVYKKDNKNSIDSIRQMANRFIKKNFKNISNVSDLRPLYVDYLKNNLEELKNKKPHQVIKKILNHDNYDVSIYYNDKFKITKSINVDELKNKTRKELKEVLNKNNINSKNTRKFNRLKREDLLKLIENLNK